MPLSREGRADCAHSSLPCIGTCGTSRRACAASALATLSTAATSPPQQRPRSDILAVSAGCSWCLAVRASPTLTARGASAA